MAERQPYAVLIDAPAQKTLAKLPRTIQTRLIGKIELLAENPRPHGAIKLKGYEAYRIRIGDYRVILEGTQLEWLDGPPTIELTPHAWANLKKRVQQRLEKRAG